MKKIRYIGNKPTKEDNVAHTGVIWNGNGDVQDVPDNAVNRLLQHAGVWESADGKSGQKVAPIVAPVEHALSAVNVAVAPEAGNQQDSGDTEEGDDTAPETSEDEEGGESKVVEEDEPQVSDNPPLVNINAMDADQLRDYAQRQFGHNFHHKTGEEKMRQTIIGLMNRG